MHKLTTALVTPFDDKSNIDFAMLYKLLDEQLKNNIKSFVVNGTTAEAVTLTLVEKRQLLEFVIKNTPENTEIIVGVSSNDTKKVIEEIKNVDDLPVDMYMICPPYYNKTSQEGLVKHFEEAFNATNKKFMLYNIPSRCCMNIEMDTIDKLLKTNKVIAIKEASGDLNYLMKLILKYSTDLQIYNGNDDLFLVGNALGCNGIISAISNSIPKEISELNVLLNHNNQKVAKETFYKLYPLIAKTYEFVNPIGVKALLKVNLNISDNVRLPLIKTEQLYQDKLRELL